jgi:hypothetical protein
MQVERVQRPDPSDADEHLLLDAGLDVAAVEPVAEVAVSG